MHIKLRHLLSAVIMTVIMSLFIVSATVYADSGYYNDEEWEELNVREDYGMDSKILSTLHGGEPVEVLGRIMDEDGNMWYYVKNDSSEGYVFAEYITLGIPSVLEEKKDTLDINDENDKDNANEYTIVSDDIAESALVTNGQEETAVQQTETAETGAISTDSTGTADENTTNGYVSKANFFSEENEKNQERQDEASVNTSTEKKNKENQAIFVRIFGDYAMIAFILTVILLLLGIAIVEIILIRKIYNIKVMNEYEDAGLDEDDDYEDYDPKEIKKMRKEQPDHKPIEDRITRVRLK